MLENINLEKLAENLEVKAALSDRVEFNDEAKKRFRKVAFDMYQSDDTNGIWKVEAGEDGKDYLVCTETPVVVEGDWKAISNRRGDTITLSYKDVPLCKFSANEDFEKLGAQTFKRNLVAKLQDTATQKQLVTLLPKHRQDILFSKYPEMKEK